MYSYQNVTLRLLLQEGVTTVVVTVSQTLITYQIPNTKSYLETQSSYCVIKSTLKYE